MTDVNKVSKQGVSGYKTCWSCLLYSLDRASIPCSISPNNKSFTSTTETVLPSPSVPKSQFPVPFTGMETNPQCLKGSRSPPQPDLRPEAKPVSREDPKISYPHVFVMIRNHSSYGTRLENDRITVHPDKENAYAVMRAGVDACNFNKSDADILRPAFDHLRPTGNYWHCLGYQSKHGEILSVKVGAYGINLGEHVVL